METYHPGLAPRFRSLLEQSASRLEDHLREQTGARREADAHEVEDFKDVAAEQAESEVEDLQAGQAAAELGLVQAALRRIDEGTYGQCLECLEPIDLRRLEAVPAAAYCTPCQTRHEARR